jgi:hypothetical protein
MNTTVRRSAVIVLSVFSVACENSAPIWPSETSQQTSQPAPPSLADSAAGTFGRMSSVIWAIAHLCLRCRTDGSTAVGQSELRVAPHDYTRNSRFVLYDNGAFLLQYPPSSFGDGQLPGAYRDANGLLMFLFWSSSGRSVDEAWDDATGTLEGMSLTIQYQESMQHGASRTRCTC